MKKYLYRENYSLLLKFGKKEVKMARKKGGNLIGSWAFLIGVILAVVLGLFGSLTPAMTTVLVIAGLIVGLLNIGDEETTPFLMAGTVLIIASSLGRDVVASIALANNVLQALLVLFVPATVIVALRHVFSLARH